MRTKKSEISGRRIKDPTIKNPYKLKPQPLPMKLRSLPMSFWRQPNVTDEIIDNRFDIPPIEMNNTRPSTQSLVVGAPDTDLLFSLFKGLPKPEVSGKRTTGKRGRPRKNTETESTNEKPFDEDPYVTSVTVPEVKIQQEAKAIGTKVVALMSLYTTQDEYTLHGKFSQFLHDLAVNL